jgi:ubiquinone/menaquinone biosynthesis C-methylase UbiE
MLEQSFRKAAQCGMNMWLGQGDIRHIPFRDGHFHLVSCLRFFNWIDEECVVEAMTELARVSCDKLLVGVRYLAPPSFTSPREASRTVLRAAGVPALLAKRWGGLVYHDKSFVEGLFQGLALEIVDARLIERRWDGTDYVFYLLHKQAR